MADTSHSKKQLRTKWLFTGGLGALLLGAGISGAIESGFLKYDSAPFWQWVLGGTGSLCLIVSGVVVLIKAAFLEQGLRK